MTQPTRRPRGNTGRARWYPLVWYTTQERILSPVELIVALQRWHLYGDRRRPSRPPA